MDNAIPLPSSVKEKEKKEKDDISFSCRRVSIVVLFHLCVSPLFFLDSVLEEKKKCSARVVGQFSSSRYHVVTLYSSDDNRSHFELSNGRVLCCYCWFGSFLLLLSPGVPSNDFFKRGTSRSRRFSLRRFQQPTTTERERERKKGAIISDGDG